MPGLALLAAAGNGPAGRQEATGATDAGPPPKAIATDVPAPKGSAAMSLAPRAVHTPATPATVAATGTARTAATGTTGRSGVRPGTARIGRAVLARSATTRRGRAARLVPSGPRERTASARTCQNASAVPFPTSARNGVRALLTAPVRNGAKKAVAAKKAGPGRRRSGRTARGARRARGNGGHLAAQEIVRAGPPGRGGPVARAVLAPVRGQRRRAPGRTAKDSTDAARPRPRPIGRGSRTASPRTSCPARPRRNSTGCPPIWLLP